MSSLKSQSARSALGNSRGAIDVVSMLVGIVIIALLAAGLLSAVHSYAGVAAAGSPVQEDFDTSGIVNYALAGITAFAAAGFGAYAYRLWKKTAPAGTVRKDVP